MASSEDEREELKSPIQQGNLQKVRRLIINLDHFALSSWMPGCDLLCEVITKKQLAIAKLLISYGCKFSAGEYRGSALHLAVVHGDLEIIKMLVERGSSLKLEDEKEMTPIHWFGRRKPVDEESSRILDFLIEKNYNIQLSNIHGYTNLHYAAECGNLDMIRLFLKHKPSRINEMVFKTYTPLHVAALNGQTEVVRFLLERGAKYEIEDYIRRTALCLAVENKHITTIEVFLDHFSRLEKTMENRISPLLCDTTLLYTACEAENALFVEILLKKGAYPNNYWPRIGKTPLHQAVEKGCVDIVRMLLNHGADPNAEKMNFFGNANSHSTGYTSLHIAADKGYEEIFKLLLEHGAKPGIIFKEDLQNPLHYAAKCGSFPMVDAILNSVHNLKSLFIQDKYDKYTPLHYAIVSGNEQVVSILLEKGNPLDCKSKTGLVPLHLAAQTNNKKIIESLLRHSADIMASGSNPLEIPLYFAAKIGNLEIMKILYEATIRKTAQEWPKYIAFYFSAFYGHESVVKYLLDKGVDPNISFKEYLTPLTAAAHKGHENIVYLLLEHGAEVNPKGCAGNVSNRFSTPLISAAYSGHEKIVEVLLNHNADINAKMYAETDDIKFEIECLLTQGHDSTCNVYLKKRLHGCTPLHTAAESGKKAIVEMLVKHGADVNAKAANDATSLYVAVKYKHADVALYLLQAGARVDVKVDYETLLLLAIRRRQLAVVEMIFKRFGPMKITSNSIQENSHINLFIAAIEENNVEIVEFFLKKGADPNFKGLDFPLHFAVEISDTRVISKLIEYGASINSSCKNGMTALCHSLVEGRMHIFKYLLKMGANFGTKVHEGMSLLQFAIYEKLNHVLVQYLLECGANVNEIADDLVSPIERLLLIRKNDFVNRKGKCEYSKDNDGDEVLELLLQYGVDPNQRMSRSEETLLSFATKSRNVKAVKLLLAFDADINFMDKNGETPFRMAIKEASKLLPNHDIKTAEEWRKFDLDSFTYEDCFKHERCHEKLSTNDYYAFIEKSGDFRAIARLMTQAIVRKEAAGEEMIDEIQFLVKSKFVERFYVRCKREIEEMKEKEIVQNVFYFDILVADENKLVDYDRRTYLFEFLEDEDFLFQFPLYREDLDICIRRGKGRKNLFEKSEKFFIDVLKVKLSKTFLFEVFGHLDSSDLRNLCRSSDPFMLISFDDKEFYNFTFARADNFEVEVE